MIRPVNLWSNSSFGAERYTRGASRVGSNRLGPSTNNNNMYIRALLTNQAKADDTRSCTNEIWVNHTR